MKRLLALLLLTALLLQGCTMLPLMMIENAIDTDETYTEANNPADETEDATEPSYPGHTSYKEYRRLYEPLLEQVPFSEMEYTRPDLDTLLADLNALTKAVQTGASTDEVIETFEPIYDSYEIFSTMSSLAYIRYTLDLNDTFYTEENDWCSEQEPLVNQALEKCYIAMADSDIREELEEELFGEDFFDYYDENQIYSNDRVVALMQEETDLQNEYMALQNDTSILWKGEERLVSELLEDSTLAYTDTLEVYRLYYEKYNPLAVDLFIRLIRVRKEMAKVLDYESYADFAYFFHHDRDYTPEQVTSYIAGIAKELSDLYYPALLQTYASEMDTEEAMALLKDVAYSFGTDIATAYDFMEAYELYDISSSASKMPGSYVTYLTSYEMPFLYVSPTGTSDDFLTLTHEFGHFVDGYVNCNETTSVDCAEIFSQALEYLSLDQVNVSEKERKALSITKMSDSVMTFLSQACYAEFEHRAYELPDEELTAENLNQLFMECNEDFGMNMTGLEDVLSPGWIDVTHFFIAPFYVISYCVSNDAALQVYQREKTQGDGLDCYYALLDNSSGNTILALLESAEMESPFKEGRAAELAEFFKEYLE